MLSLNDMVVFCNVNRWCAFASTTDIAFCTQNTTWIYVHSTSACLPLCFCPNINALHKTAFIRPWCNKRVCERLQSAVRAATTGQLLFNQVWHDYRRSRADLQCYNEKRLNYKKHRRYESFINKIYHLLENKIHHYCYYHCNYWANYHSLIDNDKSAISWVE